MTDQHNLPLEALDLDPEAAAAQAEALADATERGRWPLRLLELTDVAEAAKGFDPNALTWVVVGDLKQIEAPVRALNLGEVTVIDASGKPVK